MKRYFGSRPYGGPMQGGRYWSWDTELRRGFWVNQDGSDPEESIFIPERWVVDLSAYYMEIPRLPGLDEDLQMDEGL